MSLESLYKIGQLISDGKSFEAPVSFNPAHAVFKAHFPGRPVVPGVILLRILRDVATVVAGEKVLLEEGSNIKFLRVIDPEVHPMVHFIGKYHIDGGDLISIQATVDCKEITFIKFRGLFGRATRL